MSLWTASPEDAASPRRPVDRVAVPLGAIALVIGVGLLFGQGRFRVSEARFTAFAMRLVHMRPAVSLGDNVVFPLHGRWVGFSLSVACTAALLLVPFFVIAGLLLVARRVESRRAVVALAVTTAVIFLVNQLRLLVIAGSMLAWGFTTGYERSHVFLGTVLSTLGVIGGVIIFVWMLVGKPGQRHSGSNP